MNALVEIDELRVAFCGPHGSVEAVRGVSLRVFPGEIVGIAGESGSGKSVTCLSLGSLLPRAAKMTGSVRVSGGRRPGYIFQDPVASLNPVRTVGWQIAQALEINGRNADGSSARSLLSEVSISDPERVSGLFPHQMSGGMCQRVCIALALAGQPDLLVADEPTTALDVSTQARVIRLVTNLNRDRGMSVLLVSHDLALIASCCSRVMVMHQGVIVESGATSDVFGRPRHAYTRRLLASIPSFPREAYHHE